MPFSNFDPQRPPSNDPFARVFRFAPVPMSVTSTEGRFVDVNDAFISQFGYSREELIGHTTVEIGMIPPEEYRGREARLDAMRREGTVRGAEFTALTRSGEEREVIGFIESVEINGHALYVTTYVDVTERRRAEREVERALTAEREASEAFRRTLSALIAAEKLASLGQMVAGVAHEINNPLAFVSNNVAVIERDVAALHEVIARYREADALIAEARPELAASLGECAASMDLPYVLSHLPTLITRTREGLRRIEQIVRSLRDFARVDRAEIGEVDLNAGVTTTADIMRWQARRKSVELVLDLAELPPVPCHGGKINQVVMNLLSNAIDAAPPHTRVTVRTSVDRDAARIEVHDEGAGVPDSIAGQIFDPFFTTKRQGEGTGLGLSISYGIVREHGGTLTFHSSRTEGTTFTVALPRTRRS